MKYELPDNLKRYNFPCDKAQTLTTYRSCKHRCPNNYRQCWEQHLREDLYRDCAVENEYNARHFVTCPKCGELCDVELLFDRFWCSKCGATLYCDADEQKEIMGDKYLEIDEKELSDELNNIK